MTAKNNRRDLPPLLPIEYCSIERAARMLGCETDDILHWAEVGAINLNVKMPTTSEPSDEIIAWAVIHDPKSKVMAAINEKPLGGINFGYSFAFSFKGFLLSNETKLNSLPIIKLGFNYLSGLWSVNHIDLILFLSSGKTELSINTLKSITGSSADDLTVRLENELHLRPEQLIITANDLHKLHSSLSTGKPLANIYNDPKIAAEFAKMDEQLSNNRPAENNTPTKAMALYSLCQYVVKTAKLDPKIIDRPDALTTALNKELVRHGIPEIGGTKTLYNAWDLVLTERKKM